MLAARFFFAILFVSSCSCVSIIKSPPLVGWGRTGHASVGAVADSLLTSSAKESIYALISDVGDSLDAVSDWADDVKHEPAYRW
jgi:hypothetical protein